MRTLILDEEGNAVVTCNESYDTITIMAGEYFYKGNVRPSVKFQIGGIQAIEAVRDFLNSACSKNAQVQEINKELDELSITHLASPTPESTERLKHLKKKLSILKGNSVNGRKSL